MTVVMIIFAARPTFVHAGADNWTAPQEDKGKKVTGCTKANAKNSALEKCREWANSKSDATFEYVIQDVRLIDFAPHPPRHGPIFDNWRECTWHATYQCGYKRIPLDKGHT
jgi:hypothetical protein